MPAKGRGFGTRLAEQVQAPEELSTEVPALLEWVGDTVQTGSLRWLVCREGALLGTIWLCVRSLSDFSQLTRTRRRRQRSTRSVPVPVAQAAAGVGQVRPMTEGDPLMNAPYPMLWFDDRAEEAAAFYTSVFPDSAITHIERFSADVPGGKAGSVSTVAFTIGGARIVALNGGPGPEFNDSVSFVIQCADQAEIDRYWDALTADGGHEVMCGWLTDKFGLRWQVIPSNIGELLANPAAVQAMLGMRKLDIAALESAAAE